ncbi:cysteine proteinase [Pluteus cervinus]|uniref:Cysteine proteinase n=1 Tax=Pluteus cervinus TaxID=181527 RepID=A0ACD3B6Z5_9AGAR|nr:cysteine proteinase [Pluteus cervinus]
MAGYTANDRKQSNEISGLPSKRWETMPVPIAAPSNGLSNSKPRYDPVKNSAASGFNIYTPRKQPKNETTVNRNPRAGNHSARATLANLPPRNARKVDGGQTLTGASGHGQRAPREREKHGTRKEVLEISDSEGEDRGQLVMPRSPSSDEMNIGHRNPPTKATRNIDSRTSRALDAPLSSVFKSRQPAPDGPSTQLLMAQTSRGIELPEDPISDHYSDCEVRMIDKPPENNVKQKVAIFEEKLNPTPIHSDSGQEQKKPSTSRKPDPTPTHLNPRPDQKKLHIDLEEEEKKKVKSRMKPKSQHQQQLNFTPTPNGDPMTSATPFIKSSGSKPTKTQPKTLPVETLCIGSHRSEDGDEMELLWNMSGNMVLRYTIASSDKHLSFTFTDHEVRHIEFSTSTKPSDPSEYLVIAIFPCTNASVAKELKSAFPGHFDTVETQVGVVTLKFNKHDKAWKPNPYKEFTTWLPKHFPSKTGALRSQGSINVWEGSVDLTQRPRTPPQALRKRARSLDTTDGAGPSKIRLREAAGDNLPSTPQDSTSAPPRPKPRPVGRMANPESSSEGRRRSTRNTTQLAKTPSPAVDSDELILVYPQGTTGAVNLTNGDLRRLEPGEFLNDTLIEFGLKRWLKGLEDSQPELAKQIHVFSSFFYKKLNKKNFDEGFESVKKWTSKLKLFGKKYLIVPINENLHWYLAIIYHPEHVLLPPDPVPIRTVRSSGRNAVKSSQTTTKKETEPPPGKTKMDVDETTPVGRFVPAEFSDDTPGGELGSEDNMTDEEEPARKLTDSFNDSCSISKIPLHYDEMIHESPSISVDPAPDPAESSRRRSISLSASDYEREAVSKAITYTPSPEDVDAIMASPKGDPSKLFDEDKDVELASSSHIPPITTEDFYAPPKPSIKTPRIMGPTSKGKGKAPENTVAYMDVDPLTEEEEVEATDPSPAKPKTYIFTLDSLGSAHPKAIKVLSKYLGLEAKDKLNVEKYSDAVGKQAHVPFQPNYCDCGIYLLHFVETFMSDPAGYCTKILSKSRSRTAQDRQADWKESGIGGMRDVLKAQILSLSDEWKLERQAKENAKKEADQTQAVVIESSDDEVDIVASTVVVKRPRAKRGGKAAGSTPGPSRSR